MPRKRSKLNQGLPSRWVYKHGAYYYLPPPHARNHWAGKSWYRLGNKLSSAYKNWAEKLHNPEKLIKTISELLERYSLEVIPTKSIKTQSSNLEALKYLIDVFGGMSLIDIRPQHIYQYVDRRSQKRINENGRITGGKITAHREIEVLSHAFTKAVEWGYIDRHPFKGEVRLHGESARNRYVEDWELVAALSLKSKRKKGSILMIQAYLQFKLLTGLRQGDLLRLTLSDCKEDGIHVQPRKTAGTTGKKLIFEWSPELRHAFEEVKASRPVISSYLFCNRRGQSYINPETDEASGWKSMWQRFMDRVLAETDVKERFTEHDLRAKVASDAESLERARQLLAHADSRITERVYRRRPERIRPAGN
jgi:integrase